MAKNYYDRYIWLVGIFSRYGHSLPNHQHQTVAACGYGFTHYHALADAESEAIAVKLL